MLIYEYKLDANKQQYAAIGGLRLVGTETRKRKQDKWASRRGRKLRSHPFSGF